MRNIRGGAVSVALLTSVLIAGCNNKETSTSTFEPDGNENTIVIVKDPDEIENKIKKQFVLTDYVNPFIGTDRTFIGGVFSGNNNPGAQMPFGMVNFGPDTNGQFGYDFGTAEYGYGAGGYHRSDTKLNWFSLTHVNGPGCFSQGLVVMKPRIDLNPVQQEFKTDTAGNRIDEDASPGYYRVQTKDGIISELTSTIRTGLGRFTFPEDTVASMIIEPRRTLVDRSLMPAELADINIDFENNAISGKTSNAVFCKVDGSWRSAMYFYGEFDAPLSNKSVVTAQKAANLIFDLPETKRSATLRIGISSVSVANAKENLRAENNGWEFDGLEGIRTKAVAEWNRRLNAVQLDLADSENLEKLETDELKANARKFLTQFYTGMYRSFGGPTVYSDVNGQYRSMRQPKAPDGRFPAWKSEPERETANVKDYTFQVNGKDAGYKTHYSGFSTWIPIDRLHSSKHSYIPQKLVR